ncbi:MAG: hypothetical protein IT406_03970 [Candidatus Yanofskybacteria bacterium]|nr:hypothetical protein [Candidatus Yanofskybacteria bacterium]
MYTAVVSKEIEVRTFALFLLAGMLCLGAWLCIESYGLERGSRIVCGSALIASVVAGIGVLVERKIIPVLVMAFLTLPAAAQHDKYHLEDIEQFRDAAPAPVAPVLITDAYYVSSGGTAVHLFGHTVNPIHVGLGDKFNLNLSWRTPEGAVSPCNERAKDACRLILEVYGVAVGGTRTRTRAYGWREGVEVRLNFDQYSTEVNIPEDIPRDKAPIGDAVLVVKWMYNGAELYRFEVLLNIHA